MADLSKLSPGLKASVTVQVDETQLATKVGSGTVNVFASPMLVAAFEAAAVKCVEHLLPDGHVSLGMHLDVRHMAPTPPGLTVEATAELEAVEGRKLTFKVSAKDNVELIGAGKHIRIVVDKPRFEARLAEKLKMS